MKAGKYKKIVAVFLVAVLFIGQASFSSNAKTAGIKVKAHAYVVMDGYSGKTIYSKGASKKIYPASTAKLMTAMVVLDKVKVTKKIKFTKTMGKYWRNDVSTLNLKVGAKYKVKDYLHMLLIWSDADSALALAKGSYGSMNNFVKAMNKKAKELGMTHTKFDNPVGLDKGNGYYNTYTTANDFSILAKCAMDNATIQSIVKKASYKVPKTNKSKSFRIYNTNGFLSNVSYDKSLYNVIGTKTGTTKAAGHVLITTAIDNNGHEVICLFYGNSTTARMYQDIKKLLDYTFKQSKKGNIILKIKDGYTTTQEATTNQAVPTTQVVSTTEHASTQERSTTEMPATTEAATTQGGPTTTQEPIVSSEME